MSDSKSWEERFINRFVREDYPFLGGLHYYWKNDDNVTRVMDFIAQLLHQTRQDTLDEVMSRFMISGKHSLLGMRCSGKIAQLKTLSRIEIEKIITQELVELLKESK